MFERVVVLVCAVGLVVVAGASMALSLMPPSPDQPPAAINEWGAVTLPSENPMRFEDGTCLYAVQGRLVTWQMGRSDCPPLMVLKEWWEAMR